MKFAETKIAGAFLLTQERLPDERGFFARLWSREELGGRGLNTELQQISMSHNRKRGTLRGMHHQLPPYAETKLVSCPRGAIFDVILDLREGSPSYGAWFGIELSLHNGQMLYIPEGVAHGFLTLADDSDVLYQITAAYRPELARGVRWDDPAFAIAWPFPPQIISDRDRAFPLVRR